MQQIMRIFHKNKVPRKPKTLKSSGALALLVIGICNKYITTKSVVFVQH